MAGEREDEGIVRGAGADERLERFQHPRSCRLAVDKRGHRIATAFENGPPVVGVVHTPREIHIGAGIVVDAHGERKLGHLLSLIDRYRSRRDR